MSTTVYYEPYKLPAGMLALMVHLAFFSLLYFGFNWNRQPYFPATMNVELWRSLPEQTVESPIKPKVEEVVQPPPPPQEKMTKPDIALPEKNKPVPKAVKQDERIARQKAAREQAERLRQEKEAAIEKAAREQAAREQAAREQAERARLEEQAAATGRIVDEYKAKIMDKIRRNIVQPPDVPDNVRAEFSVTLLPGGSVLPPRLIKSSGNTAYDNAVERAILKSDPLPLPPDVQLFNRFRELDLIFKPDKHTD
jgi:colicin import membrane protein